MDVCARMRQDWNNRAKEDANYYVAFGRRQQEEEEFFATGNSVVQTIEWELKRLPPGTDRKKLKALEIGCGPGRLIKPLSQKLGEVHGIDVSDEMIRLARERLRNIPNAFVSHAQQSDLSQFPGDHFDLVYSYAVFQHIPSRDVVLQYLRETRRVLKPGGLAHFQFNGLPADAAETDTWSGVRFSSRQIQDFTREHGFELLALAGLDTQYMWTTWRRRAAPLDTGLRLPHAKLKIRQITNTNNGAPVIPGRGPFAALSIWIENLPDRLDLNALEVRIGGKAGVPTYIGPPDATGLQQLNVRLPVSDETGLLPVQVFGFGGSISGIHYVRVIPPGPAVPRIISVADAINLMSGLRIETGSVKVTLEEVAHPERFQATIDGKPIRHLELFLTDPIPPRHEVNFRLPPGTSAGPHTLRFHLNERRFAPVQIEVALTCKS